MTWRTHAVVGANAIWFTALVGRIDQSILVILPLAVFASLLPDIDAAYAKIHFIGKGVFGMFRGQFRGKYFHHRGLMHSILVAFVIFAGLVIAFGQTVPMLPPVFFLAYISHPLIDGFNSGVGFLYPFLRKQLTIVPKPLRTKVGGVVDNLLFVLGVFGILAFFFIYRTQFLPS